MDRPRIFSSIDEFPDVINFQLTQAFNRHHEFEFTIYAPVYANDICPLDKYQIWLGDQVSIEMAGGKVKFNGVICELNYSISNNLITLKGSSPTVILETESGHFETYNMATLDKVVTEIKTKTESNIAVKMPWKIRSRYNIVEKDKSITQYDETYFAFLNRLSATYGDFFFYDGETLHFGEHDSPDKVTQYIHMDETDSAEAEVSINVLPLSFRRYENDDMKTHIATFQPYKNTRRVTQNKLNDFAQTQSESLFTAFNNSHVRMPSATINNHNYDVIIRRQALNSQTVLMNGKSKNPDLKIGCHLSLIAQNSRSQKDLGEFLITEVAHHWDNGGYSNTFSGVLAQTKTLPVKDVKYPKAEIQHGFYTQYRDTNMGQGKARPFWYDKNKADILPNWMRFLRLEAGMNQSGFVTAPLNNHEVVVGYQNGDPDKPFLLSSLFNENNYTSIDAQDRKISSSGSNFYFSDRKLRSRFGLAARDKHHNISTLEINSSENIITIEAFDALKFDCKQMEINTESLQILAAIDEPVKPELKLNTKTTTFKAVGMYNLEAQDISKNAG